MPIKVALVDDHTLVVQSICRLLESHSFIITGVYATGAALLEGLKQDVPDILLLDIQLPDRSGNELARIVSKTYPGLKLIALTSMDTIFHIKDMMQHGCQGYVTKQADSAVLIQAIRKVYEGDTFMEEELEKRWMKSLLKTGRDQALQTPLSRREKEILKMIAEEYTNQEIAEKLYLSQRTVESHRYSLLQKLNVKNTAGLLRIAVQMGLIEFD